ncbi:hypothetical protein P3L51_23930 [Streptomyces sp. PSRA5]|uniref:hypothetical protein n=1 Tax=Streptomyces panacea TaxID=3035064 RepID=UPI00339BF939
MPRRIAFSAVRPAQADRSARPGGQSGGEEGQSRVCRDGQQGAAQSPSGEIERLDGTDAIVPFSSGHSA